MPPGSVTAGITALLPLYAWLNVDNDPQQEARAGARIAHDNLNLGVWRRDPVD